MVTPCAYPIPHTFQGPRRGRGGLHHTLGPIPQCLAANLWAGPLIRPYLQNRSYAVFHPTIELLGSGKAPKAHLETGLVPQVPPNKLSLYLVLFNSSARALHKTAPWRSPL